MDTILPWRGDNVKVGQKLAFGGLERQKCTNRDKSFFVFVFVFKWPHEWHMEAPRPGVQ